MLALPVLKITVLPLLNLGKPSSKIITITNSLLLGWFKKKYQLNKTYQNYKMAKPFRNQEPREYSMYNTAATFFVHKNMKLIQNKYAGVENVSKVSRSQSFWRRLVKVSFFLEKWSVKSVL